ncbi:hypothetical protein K439DRAFT_1643505 [Ramaria rubella]|nr:hypothetical protein K439DRAFT_1643505 [Ramaria rubella]
MSHYPKTRVQQAFPPPTQHLAFSPERSTTPPAITFNKAFTVSFESETDVAPARTISTTHFARIEQPTRASAVPVSTPAATVTQVSSIPIPHSLQCETT